MSWNKNIISTRLGANNELHYHWAPNLIIFTLILFVFNIIIVLLG